MNKYYLRIRLTHGCVPVPSQIDVSMPLLLLWLLLLLLFGLFHWYQGFKNHHHVVGCRHVAHVWWHFTGKNARKYESCEKCVCRRTVIVKVWYSPLNSIISILMGGTSTMSMDHSIHNGIITRSFREGDFSVCAFAGWSLRRSSSVRRTTLSVRVLLASGTHKGTVDLGTLSTVPPCVPERPLCVPAGTHTLVYTIWGWHHVAC